MMDEKQRAAMEAANPYARYKNPRRDHEFQENTAKAAFDEGYTAAKTNDEVVAEMDKLRQTVNQYAKRLAVLGESDVVYLVTPADAQD